MAEQHTGEDHPHPRSPPLEEEHRREVAAADALVTALDSAFQKLETIIGRSSSSNQQNQGDEPEQQQLQQGYVERSVEDFMEAGYKLKVYFNSLQQNGQAEKAESLRKEIALMEEELKAKHELVQKNQKLIQNWSKELKEQLDKHKQEREKV